MTTSQADINTNSNSTTTNATTVMGGGNVAAVTNNSGLDDSGGTTTVQTNKQQNLTTMVNNSNSNSNNQSSTANSATISDMGKRKKLKSRSSGIVPTSIGIGGISGGGYSKDHLDAWLETCLKDASTTQYSSSSEFLDYNPTSVGLAATPQQQQQSVFNMANNMNQSQPQQQQHQLQQQQQQQQQQFAMRTNPIMNNNLPNSNNSFNNFPFSQGFQRQNQMPNFMKTTTPNSYANRYNMMFLPMGVGGGGSGGGFYTQNDGSQDFASLPPMVNIMGGGSGGNSSEHENNSTDVMDGSANRGFRFSDPCLLNPSDNDSKLSGQNTPDRRANMPSSDMDQNNKFFNVLMEQIQLLHETNTKICRDLHEAKVCIEVLKHAPNLGMRHRRDSISGLSTHSQPMVFGSGFGTHSPAPSFHSGAYTPGIMTDVVREVKDAARVREDALLNRVKALVEERQWSMNESNLRMMRDIEELKSQVHHLRLDRKETNKRLNHLEAENKYMRQMLAALYNNRTIPDIIYENETLRTRKSFPHSRRNQAALNLHYGTIHHQTAASSSLDEQDEEPLHIVETPSTTSTADIAAIGSQRPSTDMRHSFSSSDGGSVNGGGGGVGGNANILPPAKVAPIMSPPNFALISSPCDEMKRKKEKGTATKKVSSEDLDTTDTMGGGNVTSQELRRELKEAVAARKDADDRIIALEKLVKTLQVNAIHPPSSSNMANIINDNNNSNQASPPPPPSPSHGHKKSQSSKQQQQHYQHHHHQHQTAAMSNGDGNGGGGGGAITGGVGAGHNHKSKLNSSNTSSSSGGGGGPNKIVTKRGVSSSTTASTVASRSKWLSQQNQPQQQQQHLHHQHNQHHQQQQSVNTSSVHSSPVKLSVAGPITDL